MDVTITSGTKITVSVVYGLAYHCCSDYDFATSAVRKTLRCDELMMVVTITISTIIILYVFVLAISNNQTNRGYFY